MPKMLLFDLQTDMTTYCSHMIQKCIVSKKLDYTSNAGITCEHRCCSQSGHQILG